MLIRVFVLSSESLVHNRDHVTVAIEDLDAFDAELADKIRKSPADYLPLVRCLLNFLYILVIISMHLY